MLEKVYARTIANLKLQFVDDELRRVSMGGGQL